MFPNAKGSELLAILATLDPSSQAAGTATTGWISAANHHGFLAIVQTGVLGTGATIDAKLQQAQDASGTGAKDISGKAIIQLTVAVAASQTAAQVLGISPRELPAHTANQAAVVQIV